MCSHFNRARLVHDGRSCTLVMGVAGKHMWEEEVSLNLSVVGMQSREHGAGTEGVGNVPMGRGSRASLRPPHVSTEHGLATHQHVDRRLVRHAHTLWEHMALRRHGGHG